MVIGQRSDIVLLGMDVLTGTLTLPKRTGNNLNFVLKLRWPRRNRINQGSPADWA